METQHAETEEMEFSMVSASRQTEPEHNVTQGGNQVAWLNADRGRMVGPGRTQEIYAGDSLKLQVHGKYLEDKKLKANAASFMSAGAADRLINDLNELALSNLRAGGANPIALLNLADILAKDLQKKEAPEAYLMYALYDRDSNRYEVGKKVLSKNAANQHEVLEENMYISRDGYMETFVVNETAEDVWFDNMMVMSVSSAIVQETHYDPWGLELTGLGYQYGGIKANKYLYNGKEMMDDQNLNLYDYGARYYDPVIGRWTSPDPMASEREWVSPYNFVQNNPMSRIDPDGMFDIRIHGENNSSVTIVTDLIDIDVNAGRIVGDLGGNYSLQGDDILSAALDIVGVVDPTGIADGLNAGLQAKNGDWLGAAISTAGIIPYIGDVAKVGKIGKDVKIINNAIDAVKSGDKVSSTSRAARREAMRDAGIPTSQQPKSQSRNSSGREYTYEVPAKGGGTQTKSVQQQTLDRSHQGQPHWEAGKVKTDNGKVRMNNYGRPKLDNNKSKVNYND
ncbi:hypothetical protein LZF95_21065 [Algoriphagus sp. AGSA1]|nr:hypothetical protein [Algoriphagus sp. AGSA1]